MLKVPGDKSRATHDTSVSMTPVSDERQLSNTAAVSMLADDRNKGLALLIALMDRHYDKAIQLIKAGADPATRVPLQNAPGVSGIKNNSYYSWNAVHLVVFHGERATAVLDALLTSAHPNLLSALNAKISLQNSTAPDYTPLLLELAQKKQISFPIQWVTVRKLLLAGADPSIYRDYPGHYAHGHNVVHLIAAYGDNATVQSLLVANHRNLKKAFLAEVEKRTPHKPQALFVGPLQIAQQEGNLEVAEILEVAAAHFSGGQDYLKLFLTQKLPQEYLILLNRNRLTQMRQYYSNDYSLYFLRELFLTIPLALRKTALCRLANYYFNETNLFILECFLCGEIVEDSTVNRLQKFLLDLTPIKMIEVLNMIFSRMDMATIAENLFPRLQNFFPHAFKIYEEQFLQKESGSQLSDRESPSSDHSISSQFGFSQIITQPEGVRRSFKRKSSLEIEEAVTAHEARPGFSAK